MEVQAWRSDRELVAALYVGRCCSAELLECVVACPQRLAPVQWLIPGSGSVLWGEGMFCEGWSGGARVS